MVRLSKRKSNILKNDLKSLGEICQVVRANYRQIVMTTGGFDLIHVGHIKYLQETKQALNQILLVGIDSDSLVKKLKGNCRPIQNETERASIMASLRFVDLVYIADDWQAIITEVKPETFVVSRITCPIEERYEYSVLSTLDTNIVTLDPMSKHHSSDIIDKIIDIFC